MNMMPVMAAILIVKGNLIFIRLSFESIFIFKMKVETIGISLL